MRRWSILRSDFTSSNAVLVATIQATSPAPGNYYNVSNAATSAVQPADLPPLTNNIPTLISEGTASAAQSATNYTNTATNDLHTSLALAIASAALSSTNYTDSATNGLISASYIATNNPAFVEAVTNCPVVVAAEDALDLGDYGTYGTIGAALAALVAGLAALKKLKLNSTSAAPDFSETASYGAGEYVTKDGGLYMFTSAHAAGAWTGNDATAKNMTTPDATVDIMSSGRLRVVMADGTIAWQEGYGRTANTVTDGSVVLDDIKNNYVELPATAEADTTISLVLPQIYVGDTVTKDFVVDVANLSSTYALTLQVSPDQLDVTLGVFVRSGESLQTTGTIAAGETARLYFTQTKFTKTVNGTALPVYLASRQTVEDGGASS